MTSYVQIPTQIEVTICGMHEAMQLAAKSLYTKIVSLVDHNSPIISHGKHHLVITMADIVEPLPSSRKTRSKASSKRLEPILPTLDHLVTVLAHTASLKDGDSLLIHCAVGKSRSTAMAIAILIQHGWDYRSAFFHVKAIRPIMNPNRLILSLVDDYFGIEGALVELKDEWLDKMNAKVG